MADTAEKERREKLTSQITNYVSLAPIEFVREAWEWLQATGKERVELILYIVEHYLDPEVPTDHHPTREKLEHEPTAKLREIAAEIEAAIK